MRSHNRSSALSDLRRYTVAVALIMAILTPVLLFTAWASSLIPSHHWAAPAIPLLAFIGSGFVVFGVIALVVQWFGE